MITEILGLAGSGIAGSLFGMVSDFIQSRHDQNMEKIKYEQARESRLAGVVHAHLSSSFVRSSAYKSAFVMLTATYCACALICLCYPGAELLTFKPGAEPQQINILWGFLSFKLPQDQVYILTTGGVGYALLHPIAFQIGTVITGLNASK